MAALAVIPPDCQSRHALAMATVARGSGMNSVPRAVDLGVVGCHACGLVCERAGSQVPCPRCQFKLACTQTGGLDRTAAYLLASLILYVPANLLPVMYTSRFGAGGDSTILAGVISATCRRLGYRTDHLHRQCRRTVHQFIVLGLLLLTVYRCSPAVRRGHYLAVPLCQIDRLLVDA